MADPNVLQPVQHRSACAECQRRKQKCNRQWPCNQCQKRKVASKCAFTHSETSSVGENRTTGSTSQKRSADFEDDDNDNDSLGEDDDIDADAFSKMGYLAGSLVSDLLSKTVISVMNALRWNAHWPHCLNDRRWVRQYHFTGSCRLVLTLPQYTDALVQIFFNTVNYHYYIIYPPVFLDQYQKWWDARLGSQPLSIEWTALLAIICSVTTQHLDANTRAKIETEMGDSVDNLSVSYLDLTRNLSAAIPIGSYHILNIQRMLHTIYWFKSEARFPEAYLLISEAVGEATELGLHIEARAAGLPEFDREMRRRVWCVLDTQFASGLARPTLIDHGTSSVAQPTLALEEFYPSPLLHMKLQSEAIALLASRFQAPKNVVTPKDIQDYKGILETWIRNFPAVYSTTTPDESKDYGSPWITHHRFYLHTMAYLMILNPIRRYLAQTFSPETPQEEHVIRQFGVDYSLLNLETTTEWAKFASHRDGRFHFIIFSLFDTVAVLSAAILNDKDSSIPRRTEIIDAIDEALITLKKIYNISKTAKQSYDILSQLVRRIPRRRSAQSKRKRFGEVPQFVAGQAYGAPALIQDPTVYLKPSSLSSDTTTSPPSQFSSSESAESGSTPQSNHIPTPEYQPAYLEPQVQESLAPAYPTVQQPCNMDAHYPAQHAQALGQSQQVLYMNPAHVSPSALQGNNPQPQRPVDIFTGIPAADGHIHPMPFEPINDDVMGDFSMLWNWRSLNLPFISSQIPLPEQTN
ncbi:unnamed protein product [Clonostachys chloroleuca]|uniref:Zn(2)-C6 fungal-type domain-containing protein n=1 Tax=Clonostachys chloroleuca TaxID=1926264 RepID=A0AA35QFW7_9HYPO|nr:unnamed protein product [Clonostachys chloroleuca]